MAGTETRYRHAPYLAKPGLFFLDTVHGPLWKNRDSESVTRRLLTPPSEALPASLRKAFT
jgi:hypothetical protein